MKKHIQLFWKQNHKIKMQEQILITKSDNVFDFQGVPEDRKKYTAKKFTPHKRKSKRDTE